MVVLFMVLRDDTINQTMLVPMDLRKLIPKDHPCYFIKNVADYIDCSKANREFADTPGEFAYPRELLLRLVLMSVFDGGLSSREIERRTQTDVGYMYLAGMQHPSYRTILRFKRDYSDLIDEAFKMTIKIATEEDLVKIHHVSVDGTKIKAKTSINKLTNEQQLKIMKQHLEEDAKVISKNLKIEEKEKRDEQDLQVGNMVRINEMEIVGEVIAVSDTDITIEFGSVKLRTTADKVVKISKKEAKKSANNPTYLRKAIMEDLNEKSANFNLTLDVRGMRGEEAIEAVAKYIDDASLLCIKNVSILHGKGNGILRQMIRQYLSKQSCVRQMQDASLETGGHGITRVELK